jgi:hypothetical protein
MTGVIIATWPIALLIVLAIVGIPLWMTIRHRHAAPDYREARAHYRAKDTAASGNPTSDFVPTERVAAVDGLTIVRKTSTAQDDDLAVPAQRRWLGSEPD